MFKTFLKKWRHKVLAKPDSTVAEVRARCAATRKVSGVYRNHEWQLLLVYVNGNTKTELTEAPARFNKNALGKSGLIAWWLDDLHLSEYLRRCQVNADHVSKGGKWQYAPYSYEELANSAACTVDFNLKNITSTIEAEETRQKNSMGYLSKNPSLLPYSPSAEYYRVYLKVDWAKQ